LGTWVTLELSQAGHEQNRPLILVNLRSHQN